MKNKTFSFFLLIAFLSLNTFAQNSDAKMYKILQEKRAENLNKSSVEGYKIQLYYGMSEKKAVSVRAAFSKLYPKTPTRLFYKQPEWKVHIGNFRTKLEAKKMHALIKEEFANSFILKTKIKN